MQALLVSEPGSTALRIRSALLASGYDCPAAAVRPADVGTAPPQGPPDLVVVSLTPDPEGGMTVLAHSPAAWECPVLAVGPAADARLVLGAMRAGAADFVDDREVETDLAAAVDRLRAGGGRAAEPGKTIAVLAPSGGGGASTVAVNVATVLAREHKTALLVDLKLHNGDLSALLDVRPEHTLAELCQTAGRIDRSVFEQSLARHPSGVHLLAAPRLHADAQLVTADGVRQVLALGRAAYPYVVTDVDHTFGPEQAQALRQSDVVLLVLRLDFPSLRNTRRALADLDQLGVGPDRVRVVANRYGQYRELPAEKAEEALGVRIGHYLPEDPKAVNRAGNDGVPVVRESPSARVAKSLVSLAASVNGRKHH